ncbi:MAG TPA: hypothetical protein V6C97_01090, partial [Oculatellaceae cyanobacterium]
MAFLDASCLYLCSSAGAQLTRGGCAQIDDVAGAEDDADETTRLQAIEESHRDIPVATPPTSKSNRVKILCVDISNFPPMAQLVVLSLGIFFFFMMCSYIEEYTFARIKGYTYGVYMTFVELVFFTIFALVERYHFGEPVWSHKAPLQKHWFVAAAMFAARGLTNTSLQYLKYVALVFVITTMH